MEISKADKYKHLTYILMLNGFYLKIRQKFTF